ncbi:MAG: NUDIX domain-containing protein [Chloroflexi bacterium]|nr:MAG: NUDIX domain-containing protein [Chloroflexota bacterium]
MMALMAFPYRFCPTCGALLDPPDEDGVRQVCLACGDTYYHNAKPCAGAFVVRDGKVMLIRRGIEPYKGYWDIPGGFLAPGEHPEAGAVREVREETGLLVQLTDLVGIFVDTYGEESPEYTLNIYYRAEVVEGVPEPRTDAVEIGWFGPDELPENIAFSHARSALEAWARMEQGYQDKG